MKIHFDSQGARLSVIAFSVLLACALSSGVASAQPPVYTYQIVTWYPHAEDAFTQGLVYEGGRLYESTGLHGSSSLREVDLQSGAVLRKVDVPSQYFAEGMTLFQGKIFQLTWQSQVGFIYDPATFAMIGGFSYTGEGWGLTHDAQHLIMSDGTNRIRFLDPVTFQVVRTIDVLDHLGNAVNNLNELEFINGEIYANIWQTDWIVRINPTNGAITARIDLTGLRTTGDVLNGIAYDSTSGHLLVTGKLWPRLYRITLVPVQTNPQITTPTPGSTLSGTTQLFQWSAGTGVASYFLYVGSSPGATDIYAQNQGMNLSATVSGLPTDGRTIYVRLWWFRSGSWQYADFTFKAASAGPTNPQITKPLPGSILGGSTELFEWSPGTSVTGYFLFVGSSPGGDDIYRQHQGTSLSATVSGLPTDGRTIYLRLWFFRSSWQYADFTFTAATVANSDPQITKPQPSSTLAGSTVLFEWSAGTGVAGYYLYIGSSLGGADLYSQHQGTNLSATVSGLPTDGRTIYVRLWFFRGGSWFFGDFTFKAATGSSVGKLELL
jgi:glutamine cyclotransferase